MRPGGLLLAGLALFKYIDKPNANFLPKTDLVTL
jgi:hypothetical protein